MKLIGLLVLSTQLHVLAQETPYELARLDKLRTQKIAEIDKVYLGEVKKLVKLYTKRGDLNSANLANDILKMDSSKEVVQEPKTDKQLTIYIRDSQWKFSDGKVITFNKSGIMTKSWGKNKPKWIVKDQVLICEGKVFSFNQDYSKIKEDTKVEFEGWGDKIK